MAEAWLWDTLHTKSGIRGNKRVGSRSASLEEKLGEIETP